MKLKTKKGFTIIEVVLVLAIAGLIFLMVFIALPNMQRSQRDTQRRNDYAAFAANITNYLTNNNGNLPGAGTTLDPKKYVNTDGADSAGKAYKITVKAFNASDAAVAPMNSGAQPNIYLVLKAKCDNANQGKTVASNGNRDFAVLGQLETGVFCQDNV